ncbi:helix-turn-helix domain-containing protein [Altibacter sp. HG106]|uniref:helix-turn-helix domain-containing protein n=1 Tax=Altibacter sp. HG106 TaxID=3023937 RepID=UPI002350672F|nr:helix-turn-helix transcriptional regulator [Altibacter sp. HG106]MDC7995509.1 helix-turn-helix transcriptional regulator [Altibacter sp. HG106]
MSKSELDKKFIEAFGDNLRKVRHERDMSMEDLAHASELEYSQISRIERGIINTKITTVNAIAKGLKISPKQLFDFKK